MKSNVTARIEEALKTVDLKKPATVTEAARRIIESPVDLSAGNSVAVIDDPTFPASGQVGKVRGKSAKGEGFVDVELANGTVMPLQADLLIKL